MGHLMGLECLLESLMEHQMAPAFQWGMWMVNLRALMTQLVEHCVIHLGAQLVECWVTHWAMQLVPDLVTHLVLNWVMCLAILLDHQQVAEMVVHWGKH